MKNKIHLITSRSVLSKMRTVSQKRYKENKNSRFMFNNGFSQNRAVYEIKWKNIVQPDRPQMTIECMPIARWIPKARYLHSEYVILIAFPHSEYVIVIAFPLQEWMHDRASLLR
jgi:hypothetical protein